MDSLSYLKRRTAILQRQYSHRPRYLAWRTLWVAFLALFKKSIPQIFQAQGPYRDQQLAALKILNEVDYVCKKKHLTYWLDFGTLLGAVRHHGFIPWDDDVDISMKRSDYERFVDIFNQHTRDKKLYASWHLSGGQIQVKHRLLSSVFVDIFPSDFCYKNMDKSARLTFSKHLKHIAKSASVHNAPLVQSLEQYTRLRNEIPGIVPNSAIKKPLVFYGIEFYHRSHPYNIFDYDTIFPLKEVEFEGAKFPAVAKPKEYLTEIYSNWQQIPSKLYAHSSEISQEEQALLHNYVHGENK